jgi:biopolymer transport protein ExbD
MSFGSFNEGGGQPMAEINTTPLVDVMLVLLVIFIITAPLFNQAVPIDLPKVNARDMDDKPLVLRVALDAQDRIYLNDLGVSFEDLDQQFRTAMATGQQPEMHLRADRSTRYESIARIMAAAQRSGLEKIAFVTDPAER